MRNYDVAILGSGPGGYVAALYAARHNMKVCVIEKDLIGGTCLNQGCIPTKVMLHTASLLSSLKNSSVFGIDLQQPALNFSNLINRKSSVVTRLRSGVETLLRARGIEVIRGVGFVRSDNSITITGQESIAAKNIIVATGSSPLMLPGIDVDEISIMTSDGILGLKELPKSLVIIGGGVIGVEFASLFCDFGVKVSIVEMADRLIPMQSREASRKLEASLRKKGAVVFLSSKVNRVTSGASLSLCLSDGKMIEAEKILVAVGRKPNVSDVIDDSLGVSIVSGRFAVDSHLRVGKGSIYAIGDCVPGPLLAHKASYDALVAVDNILGKDRAFDYSLIPSCIYTDPEIASVGLSEESAKEQYPDCKVSKFPYLASGKAFILGKSEGYIKIVGAPDGAIIGIEIMGEDACNLIGEAALAKTAGLKIQDIAGTVHGHPTLSEIFHEAAHSFLGYGIHTI